MVKTGAIDRSKDMEHNPLAEIGPGVSGGSDKSSFTNKSIVKKLKGNKKQSQDAVANGTPSGQVECENMANAISQMVSKHK